jgi:hypothetical protein
MNQSNPEWVRQPKQPPAHVMYAHKNGRGALTFEQVAELVKAINRNYVAQKNKMSYLSQHQARAEMNRIFGYLNWDSEVTLMRCDYEERLAEGDPRWPKDRNSKPKVSGSGAYWVVGYEGAVKVTIRDLWGMPLATYTEHHFEESAPQPNRGEARALALTSVESYALRRALINMGDRFGLGLYNGGSMAPHGIYTVQLEPGQLFDWAQAGAPVAAAQAAAPYVQPTHETIPAEPAVAEGWEQQAMVSDAPSDGDDGAPARRPSRTQQRFAAAREQVQQGNMQARLQAGMKHDDAQEAERQRYERENDYSNMQAAQQAPGGGPIE